MVHKSITIKLPSIALGTTEINQILRELRLLNDQTMQFTIRHPDKPILLLSAGYLLDKLIADNELDLVTPAARDELRRVLENIKTQSPVINISFARDVISNEIEPIINWIRSELHPTALIHIGIKPEIIGGCIIRTANHYYDFSFKQYFNKVQDSLLMKVRAL